MSDREYSSITTEDVKIFHALGLASLHLVSNKTVADKAFDHWLEQHDTEVAKATEERIIKLLEDEAPNMLALPAQSSLQVFSGFRHAIWLIKGENK